MPYPKTITTILALLFAATANAQQAQPINPDGSPRPTRHLTEQPTANINTPPPNVGEMMQHNNGSLYRATAEMDDDPRLIKPSDVSYFAVPEQKPKTLLKHDLVTIVINEESEFSSDSTTDLKKNGDLDGKVAQFPSFSSFFGKNAVGTITPELNLSASRDFKGQGTVDRTDSFTARIQAEVLDVKPNGTLVVQARKRIVTDEEEQLIVLTGVCRVEDITPDNTVLSSQLYDLDVRKTSSGAVRDTTKRGWIPRILDWANPF